MEILFDSTNKNGSILPNKLLFAFLVALIIPVILLFRVTGSNEAVAAAIAAMPLVVLLLFNFDSILVLLTGTLYINVIVLGFHITILFPLVVLLSFLMTHKNIHASDLKSPLLLPAICYFLAVVPSLVNSAKIFSSIYLMYNFLACVIIVSIFYASVNSYAQINKIFMTFLILNLVNGLQGIMTGIVDPVNRNFGFLGIVFVDFAAMSLLIAIINILLNKGIKKVIYVAYFLVMFLAFIFTQTRNTLVTLSAVVIVIIGYLFKNNKRMGMDRKRIVAYSSFFVVAIISIIAMMFVFTPLTFSRLTQHPATISYESDFQYNSLATRFLIWMTAWNAFTAHPFVGIGYFSFPFSSHIYSTIPKTLYKLFVEGLTTHVTFITVLTETGIVGFVGFIIYLVSSIKIGLKSIKLSLTDEQLLYSMMILFLQVYVMFSMLMSDAWLFGQCGMLWGIILGLTVANYKMIVGKKNEDINRYAYSEPG